MKAKPRYLTKSRFKLALECPTKLFYTQKEDLYPNSDQDDPFLAALARGGYQVGELAKSYYPEGHSIETLDFDQSEKETQELLKEKNVVIFEPAIRFKNLFARIDILVKKGNKIELIEVKAKSIGKDDEAEDGSLFFSKREEKLDSKWSEYLYDIAFQHLILSKAYPDFKISSYLMLADKDVKCATDGLNQKFLITKEKSKSGKDRTKIKTSNTLTPKDLEKPILRKVPVDEHVEFIQTSKEPFGTETGKSFEKEVFILSDLYKNDKRFPSPITSKCGKCEFLASLEDEKEGKLSGFKECLKTTFKWKEKDFKDETIFSIWNSRRKDRFIEDEKIKMKDLCEEDLASDKENKKPGLSSFQRQWLQVEKVQKNDKTPYFDKEGLAQEMKSWKFPLHMIDFETTAVAIPFNKGRRPYETITFQFSHNIIKKDGSVSHAGQYINMERGVFPNYDFLRNLKKQLENDKGTIFRYSSHENTCLNAVYQQLLDDKSKIPDKDELITFIKSITKSPEKSLEKWHGERAMVDLLEMVKRYYYDPYTQGSNSIKYVLPAILNSSKYLQKKYSKPIYGAKGGIESFNFKNWIWLEFKNGVVVDPYSKLPKLFDDVEDNDLRRLTDDDESEIRNGGSALSAYGRMQFSEMADEERNILKEALLRYCELDTLAMVMIYEAWREWLK